MAALRLILCDEIHAVLLGVLCRHQSALSQLPVRCLCLMLCSESDVLLDSCLLHSATQAVQRGRVHVHLMLLHGSSALFCFSSSACREHGIALRCKAWLRPEVPAGWPSVYMQLEAIHRECRSTCLLQVSSPAVGPLACWHGSFSVLQAHMPQQQHPHKIIMHKTI